MRAEIGSMGLIRGLLDLTVLGGVGLRVLGVVANEGGVCARMLNPKPAHCGVNAGFKCATDVDGGAWDTDELLEADDAVEGVSEADDAVADDAGVQMGYPKPMVLGEHNCNIGTSTLPSTTVLAELK